MNASERETLAHNLPNRLRSVDVLRGLAALAVLFSHIKHHADKPILDLHYFLTMPLDFGELGVSLFIVISGFCIHLGVAKRMRNGNSVRSDWKQFWHRRVRRLYPPYVAAILLGLIAYQLSQPAVIASWETITSIPRDILAHLLMIHNLSPLYYAGVGNFPLWTLGMEEQLYVLYFVYLLLRRRVALGALLTAVFTLSVVWNLAAKLLFAQHLGQPPFLIGEWVRWPCGFWFNWILGAVAAESYAGATRLPGWCHNGHVALMLGTAGIGIGPRVSGHIAASQWLTNVVGKGPVQQTLDLMTTLSPTLIALASFTLLNCWVRTEIEGRFQNWWTSLLAALGLFSYSLYLTHVPILHLAESLVHFDDSLASVFLRYVLFTPLCLVTAMGFFMLIERRFLSSSTNQSHRRETIARSITLRVSHDNAARPTHEALSPS